VTTISNLPNDETVLHLLAVNNSYGKYYSIHKQTKTITADLSGSSGKRKIVGCRDLVTQPGTLQSLGISKFNKAAYKGLCQQMQQYLYYNTTTITISISCRLLTRTTKSCCRHSLTICAIKYRQWSSVRARQTVAYIISLVHHSSNSCTRITLYVMVMSSTPPIVTIQDAILTRARKPTWVSLIHCMETTTKKCKTEKVKSKNG